MIGAGHLGCGVVGCGFVGVAGDDGASVFDPADFSPLFWMDGQDLATVLDGGGAPADDAEAVATWTDKGSGGNNSAQATVGFRPLRDADGINGHSCLLFDGVDDLLTHSFARGATQTCTVIIVCSIATTAVYQRLFNTLGNGSTNELTILGRQQDTSTRWGAFGPSEYSADTEIMSDGPVLLCVERTGLGGNFYLNGTADGTFASTTGGGSGRIGGFTSQFTNGRIGEIVVYPLLSAANRALVIAGHKSKWSIP